MIIQKKALPRLCKALGAGLAELVRQMSPTITHRDVAELPLLTLGAQFQGSNNNTIGKQAVLDAFFSSEKSSRVISLMNNKGR